MNSTPNNPFNPEEIKVIFKRRKFTFLIPFTIIFLLSLLLAFFLPSYYRSSATILIEEQEIPKDFVVATVSSFAEQRLEMIKQRIMSHGRLLELINQFELYTELKDKWTIEQIVEKMRENIHVTTLSAEVMDRRTGRPTAVTIAFTLSYVGKNPTKVHQVTSELTSLFLEENLKVRTRQTKEAIQFFEDELLRVKEDLNVIKNSISLFKEKNLLRLPEYTQINMQLLQSSEKTIENFNEQLKILAERETYYVTQLSLMTPEMEFNNDRKRLEELKIHLVFLKSKFSDEYPDVIHTKAEIEKLSLQFEKTENSNDRNDRKPDNPSYITISSQLSGVRAEMSSVRRQITEAKAKKSLYEKRIESSAKIEGQYNTLLSDQANLTSKMNELTQKLMEAKVAYGLEKDQKGERFTLIDPARLPEKPFKPNRMLLMILGVLFGVGFGTGSVAFKEFVDDAVYNPLTINYLTEKIVLGEIPFISTQKERYQKKLKYFIIVVVTIIVLITGIILFHLFIMDIDILLIKINRKISL